MRAGSADSPLAKWKLPSGDKCILYCKNTRKGETLGALLPFCAAPPSKDHSVGIDDVTTLERSICVNKARVRASAQYLEKVSLFLVAGGEEQRRRVVSEQRIQSSSWKEGQREEGGRRSADVQLLCSPFMTCCWIRSDVRSSQNQVRTPGPTSSLLVSNGQKKNSF